MSACKKHFRTQNPFFRPQYSYYRHHFSRLKCSLLFFKKQFYLYLHILIMLNLVDSHIKHLPLVKLQEISGLRLMDVRRQSKMFFKFENKLKRILLNSIYICFTAQTLITNSVGNVMKISFALSIFLVVMHVALKNSEIFRYETNTFFRHNLFALAIHLPLVCKML